MSNCMHMLPGETTPYMSGDNITDLPCRKRFNATLPCYVQEQAALQQQHLAKTCCAAGQPDAKT